MQRETQDFKDARVLPVKLATVVEPGLEEKQERQGPVVRREIEGWKDLPDQLGHMACQDQMEYPVPLVLPEQ